MTMSNEERFDDFHDCEEEEAIKVLTLTRDELLFIDDQLTMMIEKDGHSEHFVTVRPILSTAGIPAPVDLIDKIGMAVLSTTDPAFRENLSDVPVTATDLYMLREIAKSTIKINGEFVGLELKKKIYELLYENELSRDKTVEKLLSDVNVDKPIMDWSGEAG
jgi:hypothetical protein